MAKIEISDELFRRVKSRAENSRFGSVDMYVNYVLERVLANVEKSGEKTEKVLSKEEEEIVKKRLKALGYLDE